MRLNWRWALGMVWLSAGCVGEICPAGQSGGQCEEESTSVAADALVRTCERGDTQACGAWVSSSGVTLTLGAQGAAMDRNVGAGFENPINEGDSEAFCSLFIAAFGTDPGESEEWLDTGDLNLALYSVYRPGRWAAGQRYPVVVWGNGTCMQPETYGGLLRFIASQGFVVVAPNSRFVGSGSELKRAIDFAVSANANRSSPYYRRLDTSKVAVVGHSQGGQGASNVASDARVRSTAIFNAGGSNSSKPFLLVSGDRDVSGSPASTLAAFVNAAPRAAYLFYHMIPGNTSFDGYLHLITQPERVSDASVAWLRYTLSNDARSRSWFVGRNCRLCGSPAEYEYGQHGLR
jgi:pimeloyl-ACP methyl ester carboxylesterase